MSSVISLNLASNAIRSFPAALLANLRSLESLDLSDCSLIKIETGLSAFKNLRILTLSDNPQLSDLPEDLGTLSSLDELYLRFAMSPINS